MEVKSKERPGAIQGKKCLWIVLELGEAFTFETIEADLKSWVRKHKDYDLRLRRIQRGRA